MHENRACQSPALASQASTAIGSGRNRALSASISRNGVSGLSMSTWLTMPSACTPLSVRPALCMVTCSPVTAWTARSTASCTEGHGPALQAHVRAAVEFEREREAGHGTALSLPP